MTGLSGNNPHLKSLADVVRWVIHELGALCPSRERLKAYFANPQDPTLRDVRYHVEEAHCPICNAERTAATEDDFDLPQ